MSPRPPPKISLEHEWKRDLDSEHTQRPEVGQLSRSFQSNQPTPNPIRERSTHDLIGVQDDRKTSLSQEIDVIFVKNLVLLSEWDDLLPRMTWLMCQTVLKHVLRMQAKRSMLKMKYFVSEGKDPLLVMT